MLMVVLQMFVAWLFDVCRSDVLLDVLWFCCWMFNSVAVIYSPLVGCLKTCGSVVLLLDVLGSLW